MKAFVTFLEICNKFYNLKKIPVRHVSGIVYLKHYHALLFPFFSHPSCYGDSGMSRHRRNRNSDGAREHGIWNVKHDTNKQFNGGDR
jgi:hypothetical protein